MTDLAGQAGADVAHGGLCCNAWQQRLCGDGRQLLGSGLLGQQRTLAGDGLCHVGGNDNAPTACWVKNLLLLSKTLPRKQWQNLGMARRMGI